MNTPEQAQRIAGFTLISVLITVVIIGILAAIAYPSYMGYVRQSRRQQAITALYKIQLAQAHYRANHSAYAQSLGVLGLSATTTGGNYSLSIQPGADSVQYTATATANAGTTQANDKSGNASCTVLKINQDQPVYSPAAQKACWGH